VDGAGAGEARAANELAEDMVVREQEAWCLEGLPDENRIIFTVPDENLCFLRHGSLQGPSSLLCSHLPTLQLVFINWDSLGHNFATRVSNFGFFSWFLL
jgi:hypothetical protein